MLFSDIFNITLNMTQNKNYLAFQIHHFMLELLFYFNFYTVFLYFSTNNKETNFEEQHVYFKLGKSNLCDNVRINLCGSFVLLFFVFMNIVSMLIF